MAKNANELAAMQALASKAADELSGPGSGADVQPLQNADESKWPEMVQKADIRQLEAWEKVANWEVMDLIRARLQELRTPTPSPVSSPEGSGAKPPSVEKPLSPEKLFEATLTGHQLKRALMDIYRVDSGLAQAVKADYDSAKNPSLSEGLLERLADAKRLWLDRDRYRVSAGGQNGMIYYFFVQESGGLAVGEWHVHWSSGNQAGSPGWKRGKSTDKTGVYNDARMRKLLGKAWWGEVKDSSGSRILAGQ